MPDPYISVIVTAHDRRKYLPEALRSLESQTLDKDKFEVIVVKNFEDPASDEIIRRNGWRNIVTDVRPLGGKISIGMEEARGGVITFLEDDDMYAPERLQVVEKAFKDIARLTYFHNGQTVIDENGNVIPNTIARLFVPTGIMRASMLIDERIKRLPCSLDYVNILFGADFNNSSIAIKKEILQDADINMLRNLSTAVDLYLYAKSFTSSGLLYLTTSRLTLYRVHLQSFSGHMLPWIAANKSEQKDKLDLIKTQLKITRSLRALNAIKSYPAASRLAAANCGPYNLYWAVYVGEMLQWIRHSENPLSLGRVPLLEILRIATISTWIAQRYGKFLVKYSKTHPEDLALEALVALSDVNNRSKIRVMLDWVFATYFIVLRYLLQFAPKSIKDLYYDTSMKLEAAFQLREISKLLAKGTGAKT